MVASVTETRDPSANGFVRTPNYFELLAARACCNDKTSVIETSRFTHYGGSALAILTSGGDAPGMNAAIAGVCERLERIGGEACGIQGGFAGLAEQRAVPMTAAEARAHAHEAGTWLGTSRWKALETPAGRDACVQALEALGLDGLVVIGGHGSALGAQVLADAVPVAFIPATIDHDVEGTGATIGMDSAIGLALDDDRAAAGDRPLAARPGLPPPDPRGAQRLPRRRGRRTPPASIWSWCPSAPSTSTPWQPALGELAPAGAAVAVMSEAVGDAVRISEDLSRRAGIRVHPTILGHAQRAARPSERDLAMARRGRRASRSTSSPRAAPASSASRPTAPPPHRHSVPPPPRTQGALA